MPRLWRLMPGRRFDQMAAEAGRVRLDQRHRHADAGAVDAGGAEIGGVAVVRGERARRCPVGIDEIESGVDRGEQGCAVGAVVEYVGPVEAGRRRGLDQQVRPTRVVGIVGEVETLARRQAPEVR